MSQINTLIAYLETTLEDQTLSSSERKILKQALQENPLSKGGRDVIIARLYQLAEKEMEKGNVGQILEWLKKSTKLIFASGTTPQGELPEAYFSPGDQCLSAILHEINAAKAGLDICVFTISDDRITEALIRRFRQGASLRILTDNEKLYDAGSDVRSLSEAGIPVRVDRTKNHMHHKFALFDSDTVLTGSYNWTRSAEKYNNENIVLLRDPVLFRKFRSHFDTIWEKMETF